MICQLLIYSEFLLAYRPTKDWSSAITALPELGMYISNHSKFKNTFPFGCCR